MTKKASIIVLFVLGTLLHSKTSSAQFNGLGGGIVLATGAQYNHEGFTYYNKPFGIDVRLNYDLNKKFKLVPALRFYFPNTESFPLGGESKTTLFAFNLNTHYIVNPRSEYKLYLLGGAHVGIWKIKDNHLPSIGEETININTFQVIPGVNIGGGMQFYIARRVQFFAEVKYIVAKTNQMAFSPGIFYDL